MFGEEGANLPRIGYSQRETCQCAPHITRLGSRGQPERFGRRARPEGASLHKDTTPQTQRALARARTPRARCRPPATVLGDSSHAPEAVAIRGDDQNCPQCGQSFDPAIEERRVVAGKIKRKIIKWSGSRPSTLHSSLPHRVSALHLIVTNRNAHFLLAGSVTSSPISDGLCNRARRLRVQHRP